MADVYLAIVNGPSGSGFTKLAVVKRLRPNLVEEPEFVAMLVDEARISARLNHPNVVQTHEVGIEGEEYYLAMEFLDGQPLHRIQRRAARAGMCMPRGLQYLVVVDTVAGLHHAHELADYDGSPLGIVHRDINPQNVFVTYEGLVKIVDFGIAKAAGRAAETKAGIVKGKVRYMSPEQAMGHAIDRRCDVFAAGLLLWEAATGRHFWENQDELTILQALITGNYDASPRSIDKTVPLTIDAICRKALAFNRDDRHASASELGEELETFLADEITAARRQLGPFVAALFDKERKRVRSVIEQASRIALDAPSVAELAVSDSAEAMALRASSPPAAPSLSPFVISAPQPAMTPLLVPRAARAPSRVLRLGAVAAALSIFVLAGLRARADARSDEGPRTARAAGQIAAEKTQLVLNGSAKSPPRARASATPQAPFFAAPSSPSPQPTVAPQLAAAPPKDARAPSEAATVEPLRRRPKAALDMTDPWQTAASARASN